MKKISEVTIMKKISFVDKVLFFIYYKGINDEIPADYNHIIRSIIYLVYWIICIIIGTLISILNIYIRIFICLLSTYIAIELSYILTIRKYNKYIKSKK